MIAISLVRHFGLIGIDKKNDYIELVVAEWSLSNEIILGSNVGKKVVQKSRKN